MSTDQSTRIEELLAICTLPAHHIKIVAFDEDGSEVATSYPFNEEEMMQMYDELCGQYHSVELKMY